MPQRLGDQESRRRLKEYTDKWKASGDVRFLKPEERSDMADILKRFLLDAELEELLEGNK